MLQKKKRLVIPIMTHPGIELCGSTVLKAVTDGQAHADAILALNDKFPADAVTAIMDLTVEAEAFGAEIKFSENDIPNVIGRLVSNYDEVAALEIPTLDKGRIPEYLKANSIVASHIKDKRTFGGCIGPFSLAGRLFDLSELMMAMYIEPETVTMLLDKCTNFITEYLKAMKETGINGVILAEPAAGLVSNDDCLQYSATYVRKIVNAVQDERFLAQVISEDLLPCILIADADEGIGDLPGRPSGDGKYRSRGYHAASVSRTSLCFRQ